MWKGSPMMAHKTEVSPADRVKIMSAICDEGKELMNPLVKRDEIEAQAYAMACDWFRFLNAPARREPGEAPWLSVSPIKGKEFGTLFVHNMLRRWMLWGRESARLDIIALARAGWDRPRAVVPRNSSYRSHTRYVLTTSLSQ
jgi:hypothetical protein